MCDMSSPVFIVLFNKFCEFSHGNKTNDTFVTVGYLNNTVINKQGIC